MVIRSKDAEAPLIAVLPTLTTLVTRAVLIPSTPRRTMVLSFVAFLPTIGVAFVLGSAVQFLTLSHTLARTAYATTWAAATVAICTLASRIIYGLEQKVREARQLGQYTLAERIGAGGMGIVYRARHAMLRRPTAVKVLPPDKMGEINLRRFEREVQLTSQLTHPNTISIYDYGRTADGLFYYAMEYLDGFTLTELVEVGGPLPPARGGVAHTAGGGLYPRSASDRAHSSRHQARQHRRMRARWDVRCRQGARLRSRQGHPSLERSGAITGQCHHRHAALHVARGDHAAELGGRAERRLFARRHDVLHPRRASRIPRAHAGRDLLASLDDAPRGAFRRARLTRYPTSSNGSFSTCLAKSAAERPASAAELERALAGVAETEPWTQEARARVVARASRGAPAT